MATSYCNHCGALVENEASFCGICGTRLRVTQAETSTPNTFGSTERHIAPVETSASTRPKPIPRTEVQTLEPPGQEPVIRPQIQASRLRSDRTISDPAPALPSRSVGRTVRRLGAFLVSYQYEPLGTFWPLAIGPNVIGRAASQRPDIAVGISDITVSSEQAIVWIENPVAWVEDRGSTNGTFINEVPVLAYTKMPVQHGDILRFGSFETKLVIVP